MDAAYSLLLLGLYFVIVAIVFLCIIILFAFRIGLLNKWKEKNGHCATYRQLAKTLHKAGRISAVQTLCEQLGVPQQSPQEGTVYIFYTN